MKKRSRRWGEKYPPTSMARKQVGSAIRKESRVEARVARTNRGTCVPLSFHVTSGQPAVGQGVVIHTEERDLISIRVLMSISLM
ncbi:unnamed protein product [Spirodela intermedia]|uniref:Uncharacterized protein n=1 Tax=Spirodela intermedia TaxID=51605 RepID=A0A7I8J430_SPIIN|nr:unnamed protein product [Spirodela intermedia]CAA6664131.1 unnamed protein product [Spirodela intermedia]